MCGSIKPWPLSDEEKELFDKYLKAKNGHVIGCACYRCNQVDKKFNINIE